MAKLVGYNVEYTVDIDVHPFIEYTDRQVGNGDETFAKHSLRVSEQQSKVLGIQWNPAEDKLTLDLSPAAEQNSGKLTKRKMLSLLAKIFD